MKRTPWMAVVTGVLLAGHVVFTTSRSTAEPILGEESLGIPPDTSTPRQEFGDALALFKARDYEGSLKAWREAEKKSADIPPAQVMMAQLFLQAEMPKEAQNALKQAAIDAPNDPETYLLMAGMAMHDRDLVRAESLYQKANGLLSSFEKSAKRKERLQLWIYGSLATLAEMRKDWAAAQKSFEQWLKLDPKNTSVKRRIAYYLLQQKNVDGALERLRDAAKTDSAALTPEALVAQFYQRSGDRENAAKWMDTALRAAPKDIKLRLAAGQSAFEAGQLDEARKHAIAAARIDPKSLDAKVLQGSIATFEKNYVAAELFFDSALQQSPANFPIGNNLALVLIEQNEEAKGRRALELAEANAKKYPKSPEAASTYGFVLYRLGRLDEAEKVLRAAAPIAKHDLDTAYAIACISSERGRKTEAQQLLETALKSTKPAMFRQEAEDLLDQLKK